MMIPRTITSGFALLFLSLSSVALAGGFEDEDERRWSVQTLSSGNFVRAVIHGSFVYGNEFGFLLSRPSCERKVIWLSFTSYELDESAKGTVATFELVASDEMRLVQVPLLAVVQLVPGSNGVRMLPFTNRPLEPGLTELLSTSQEMEVRIVAPEWLIKGVDVPEEWFDVTGFTEAEEAAEKLCHSDKK